MVISVTRRAPATGAAERPIAPRGGPRPVPGATLARDPGAAFARDPGAAFARDPGVAFARDPGLAPGDVILEINRRPIRSSAEFAALYRATGAQMLLLVWREGSTQYLLLER